MNTDGWIALAVVMAVVVVVFLVKVIRENRRSDIWIADPQRELELHNQTVRESTWGGTSSNWEDKVIRTKKQRSEK